MSNRSSTDLRDLEGARTNPERVKGPAPFLLQKKGINLMICSKSAAVLQRESKGLLAARVVTLTINREKRVTKYKETYSI